MNYSAEMEIAECVCDAPDSEMGYLSESRVVFSLPSTCAGPAKKRPKKFQRHLRDAPIYFGLSFHGLQPALSDV